MCEPKPVAACGPSPRTRLRLTSRGPDGGELSVDVNVPLLGAGAFMALLMRLFGLDVADAAMPAPASPDMLLRGACWGALACCLAAIVAGVASARRLSLSGRARAAVSSAALLVGLGAAWACSSVASGAAGTMAAGVLLGACLAQFSVAWVCVYARAGLWDMVLHLAGSVVVAGVLTLVGGSWAVESWPGRACACLLALLSCAALVRAAGRPGDACVTEQAAETERAPLGVREALRALGAFARGQWAPLAGVAVLAFIHGLRWSSALLGRTAVKAYDMQGWEFALGPLLAMAVAWALLVRRPVASPQRATSRALIPVAAAVLLVVPVLNPLFGFYTGIETTGPAFVALEVVLDVLNEAAVSLLLFSALFAVASSVRVTGVAGAVAAAALLASMAAGALLGLYGYGVVGANGSIVCFLVWTAYLLAVALASLGRGRDERDVERLSRESVDNFIRRTSHALAQRCDLSPREEEILRYLARGYSYTHTAQDLFISENTVRTHARHIYAKLGVSRREELFALFDEAPTPTEDAR